MGEACFSRKAAQWDSPGNALGMRWFFIIEPRRGFGLGDFFFWGLGRRDILGASEGELGSGLSEPGYNGWWRAGGWTAGGRFWGD
jgi:hypothetical protein